MYRKAPSIFVSANHTSKGGNVDPMHNSITAWVEVGQYNSFDVINKTFSLPLNQFSFKKSCKSQPIFWTKTARKKAKITEGIDLCESKNIEKKRKRKKDHRSWPLFAK